MYSIKYSTGGITSGYRSLKAARSFAQHIVDSGPPDTTAEIVIEWQNASNGEDVLVEKIVKSNPQE